MWGKGVYREIVAPERIVLLDYFSDEQGNIVDPPAGLPRESVITATFAEHGGKTIVTVEHRGTELASKENQEAYIRWLMDNIPHPKNMFGEEELGGDAKPEGG